MYEYGNARVRAMKGRLLGRHALEALAARRDLGQVVTALGETAYAPELGIALTLRGSEGAAGLRGFLLVQAVEEALRLNLGREMRAILSFYEGQARQLVALLVGRYDFLNLLTVLRGRTAGLSLDETVACLLPGGQITEPMLTELATQPDAHQAAALLASWPVAQIQPLAAVLLAQGESGNPSALETSLLRSYYAQVLAALTGSDRNAALVRRAVGQEIDVVNLTTLLRLLGQAARPTPDELAGLLVEGGAHLRTDLLRSLAEPDGGAASIAAGPGRAASAAEALIARLRHTPYGAVLESALGQLAATGKVSTLQRALERYLAQRATALLHDDPLGIGVVIAYLAAKGVELANLRLIVRGTWLRLDKQEVFEQLWLPEAPAAEPAGAGEAGGARGSGREAGSRKPGSGEAGR